MSGIHHPFVAIVTLPPPFCRQLSQMTVRGRAWGTEVLLCVCCGELCRGSDSLAAVDRTLQSIRRFVSLESPLVDVVNSAEFCAVDPEYVELTAAERLHWVRHRGTPSAPHPRALAPAPEIGSISAETERRHRARGTQGRLRHRGAAPHAHPRWLLRTASCSLPQIDSSAGK